MTPKQWAALVRLNVRLGTDTVEPIPGYGDLETLGYGKNNVRDAPGGGEPRRSDRCHQPGFSHNQYPKPTSLGC
jgi:hypothetical protein